MRRLVLAIFLASPTAWAEPQATTVKAELVRPEVVEVHRLRLWNAAQPSLRAKIDPAVKVLLVRADVKPKPNEPPVDLLADAKKQATLVLGNGAGAADIDALMFLIMMQAAKTSDDDLKQLLAEIKKQRDSKNEISDEVSKRLRIYQDRRNKFYELLSNMMKKTSDTQQSLIQNMK